MWTAPVLSFALGFALTVTPAVAAIAAVQTPPVERTAPRPAPQAPAPTTAAAAVARPDAPPATVLVNDADARETRDEFAELLRKLPPSLGRVLKLDPSLLQDPTYLAPYPALAAFVSQHPEITRSPEFFLAGVRFSADEAPSDSASRAHQVFREVMDYLSASFVFIVVTGVLMWLLRTVIDYRRWSRLSKVQTEVHNKLLDKFASNDNLMAYMQTDAGRRFLESTPIMLDSESRSVGAPLNRILWSLQVGIVIGAGGLGLQLVSRRLPDEAALGISAIGAVALALGLGFIISAAASYALSRRLGLVTPTAPASASDPGASA